MKCVLANRIVEVGRPMVVVFLNAAVVVRQFVVKVVVGVGGNALNQCACGRPKRM